MTTVETNADKINAVLQGTDRETDNGAPANPCVCNCAMQQAIAELQQTWGAEHSHYDKDDWRYDVSEGNTVLGYWEWVQHNIESNGGDAAHCSCGAPLNDGEGYDGACGTCAEKAGNAASSLD